MRTEANSWRDNWFVKNWLGALPLVRSLKEPKPIKVLDTLAGDSAMLAGGALGMWLEMHLISMERLNALERTGIMLPVMWAGMAAGNLLYNTVSGTFCSEKPSEERRPLVHSV